MKKLFLFVTSLLIPNAYVFAQSNQAQVSLGRVGSNVALTVIPFFVLFIALTIFWVMMLIDCIRRDFKDKVVWVLLFLFFGYLGAILYYFLVKRKNITNSPTLQSPRSL